MPYRYRCSTVLRFADFSPEMMAVLKACLQPEPAKRLTALEVLELPYFDDVYEHLEGTELQRDYDAAYAAAAKAKAPSAHSLRTASSACIGRRIKEGSSATTLRASAVAKGFLEVLTAEPAVSAVGGGLCISRLGRSRSTAAIMFSAPDIIVPAVALVASPFESEAAIPTGPEADTAASITATNTTTTAAPLSGSALRSDLTKAGGRILRRATTLGAPEAEGLCSVFSTLESQRRPVMQPLPSAAEATAAAAEAAAAANQIATAGGRGRFGCRVRFSDEGPESFHLGRRASEPMPEDDCVDLSQSPGNSPGIGQLVSQHCVVHIPICVPLSPLSAAFWDSISFLRINPTHACLLQVQRSAYSMGRLHHGQSDSTSSLRTGALTLVPTARLLPGGRGKVLTKPVTFNSQSIGAGGGGGGGGTERRTRSRIHLWLMCQ